MSNAHKLKKVALIVGHNVSGLLIANDLIPQMKQRSLEPVLYMAKYDINEEKALPATRGLYHYESTILRETVYPLLEQEESIEELKATFARQSNGNGRQYKHAYTPKQLSQIHNIEYEEIDDVNAPDFVQKIKESQSLLGALSVRNYQIFKDETIKAFNKDGKGFLWNLHPGLLPQYRGIIAPLRAMAEEDDEHGWSLHVIDKGIDTGPLICQKTIELDYSATVFEQYLNLVPLCQSFVVDQIKTFQRQGRPPSLQLQKDDKAHYYSYPTKQEMHWYEKAGIRLFDTGHMIQTLVSKFSAQGTQLQVDLRHDVTEASTKWETAHLSNDNPVSLLSLRCGS